MPSKLRARNLSQCPPLTGQRGCGIRRTARVLYPVGIQLTCRLIQLCHDHAIALGPMCGIYVCSCAGACTAATVPRKPPCPQMLDSSRTLIVVYTNTSLLRPELMIIGYMHPHPDQQRHLPQADSLFRWREGYFESRNSRPESACPPDRL